MSGSQRGRGAGGSQLDVLGLEARVTRSQAAQVGGAVDIPGKAGACGSAGRRASQKGRRVPLAEIGNRAAAAVGRAAKAEKVECEEAAAPAGVRSSRRRGASLDKPLPVTAQQAGAAGAEGPVPMDADLAVFEEEGRAGACAASAPQDWKDVDAPHAEDPLFCPHYVQDIYRNLRSAESRHRPSRTYMESVQSDINPTMRGILVDWLVEVAEEYKLVPDTLFLSVAYIDRCLSAVVVQRAQLQLVGVTCMLIAAKYEEIYAPQVEEFCYITDNTYTREQVLSMERKVLDTLSFELTTPTTKSFLRRFLRAAEADHKAEFLGCFLAELSLLDYSFLRFMPSTIAASCVFISLWTLGRAPWSPTLRHYAGYEARELRECVTALTDLFVGSRKSTLPAVREKYSQHKFKCVSTLSPPEAGLTNDLWLL